MANTKQGIVKWFDLNKGYGFIQPEDKSKDVFVHISALQDAKISNLSDGQKVGYDLEEKSGKTSAVNISLID